MRIFVLCTGRSGSVSFIKACENIRNYTCGHETLSKELGADRLAYPENHIEADNRLSWFLGALDARFGREAFYIHLRRNKEKTVASFLRRFDGRKSIVKAFGEGILMTATDKLTPGEKARICSHYYDTVTQNIDRFLLDKPHQMVIELENIKEGFTDFWHRINAEGNLKSALNTFDTRHNKSGRKAERSGVEKLKYFLYKQIKHIS